MYIVIYDKNTKEIVRVFDEKNVVSYGYSANCAETRMETKPKEKFVQ